MKLSKNQQKLIEEISDITIDVDGDIWYHLPFFRNMGNGTFEVYFQNELPKQVQQYMENAGYYIQTIQGGENEN